MMSKYIACLIALTVTVPLCTARLFAEEFGAEPSRNAWTVLDAVPLSRASGEPWIRPEKFQPILLDRQQMSDVLRLAPQESVIGDVRNSNFIVSIPMPDGSFARFRVVESPICAPELQAKFPTVRTYLGQGIDDPTATIRFDSTILGFHAQVLSPHGAVYIDPYTKGDDTLYTSYYKRDLKRSTDWVCDGPEGVEQAARELQHDLGIRSTGSVRKEYRLACACTGEYSAFFANPPTVAASHSAIVTAINRVTGVYETELAVRMILIANNDSLIYLDGTNDPYTNDDGGTMLGQNQTTVTNVIGSANYDIGHVFSTGGGGVAGIRVVCVSGSKARGVTGLDAPTGDGFYIDFVAHEMGHQFGANHTFNGNTTNCGSNRNASTAYEVGSGSTIMSYAGVCGVADNLQAHSDPYFHSVSITEITNYITTGTGSSCPVNVNTGNNQPTVNAGPDYTIPVGTPFVLTAASASDPDGDPLTFCWEERDLGPAQPGFGTGSADNGTSPIFRSWLPVSDNFRICPRLLSIINNTLTIKNEKIPALARTSTWRCTVRDNRAGAGGANSDDMVVTIVASGGAFSVTSPNTNVTWSGTQTVTWTVAGTDVAPVNCPNVKISLSTDSGNTFPYVLAASTANNGSAIVTLPNVNSTTARIKVESIGNIFFDFSNVNFTITSAAPNPPGGPQANPSLVCPLANVSLSGTVGGTEVIDWYTGSCGATFVGTGNPLGINPAATTTYFARARDVNTGLSSPTCTSAQVIVYVPGDVNGDASVNELDIPSFVDAVLGNASPPLCALDFDNDGDVDGDDLVQFVHTLVP